MSKPQIRKRHLIILLFLLASLLACPTSLWAQSIPDAVAQAAQEMGQLAGVPVEMTRSRVTGVATFVTTTPGRPIPVMGPSLARPQDRALAFLDSHGPAFGLKDSTHVRVMRVRIADEVGMDHVRLQQVHKGIPVTGGELTIHLRGQNVVAVLAKTLPGLETINTTPSMSQADALLTAQRLLEKQLGVTDAVLSEPRLEILNRGILEGIRHPTLLAWFIEATKLDLREFIWVDAHTGGLLLRFSQLTDALSRSIYDAGSASTLPGTLVRSEGGPAAGDTDADSAYAYSGDTYHYFFTQHGRDSYDNAGAPLISTVHYCPSPSSCPYQNAFWNGAQMVYGDGFSVADDVDAHELTHAVTEHSANLFYYMQSGALNESFSDIFGETVDLTNTGGTDTSVVRWLMGEDVPGLGAIRNMMDPTVFEDPGKMSDPNLACFDSVDFDNGGVHYNSGVPNHAYALMVDGGSYNGFTVTGIGLTKAGKIEYRALTQYLISASDFLDDYNAVKQACTDLIGTAGITASDCTEVTKALDAVEMSSPWPCAPLRSPRCPLCARSGKRRHIYFSMIWKIRCPGSGAPARLAE